MIFTSLSHAIFDESFQDSRQSQQTKKIPSEWQFFFGFKL